jgi:uncharacterized membrane protein (DUF441 family)
MTMSDQNDSVDQDDSDVAIDPVDIQFDQAEYTTPAPDGPSCNVCHGPIDGEYYETGGKVFCLSCRHKVEAAFHGGSRAARVFKALVLGAAASAVGAVLYYAILRTTGYNIGLVAVVVGVMVGRAVRTGTGGRGGRFYQFLAVFLTYSAIVAMYVAPSLLEDFAKRPQDEQQAELKIAKVDRDAAKPAARSEDSDADKDSPSAPKVDGQMNPAAEPKIIAKDRPEISQEKTAVVNDGGATDVKGVQAVNEPAQILLALLVVTVFWIGFFYTIPVQIAVAAPISGLIFSFALWEAWKANRGVHLSFNGPFRASKQSSSGPKLEVERDGE